MNGRELIVNRASGRSLLTAILWLAGVVTASANDVQVTTDTTDEQAFSDVAVNADGEFVIVWGSEGSSGTDSSGFSIQGQRFDANGSALGGAEADPVRAGRTIENRRDFVARETGNSLNRRFNDDGHREFFLSRQFQDS